MGYWKGEKKKKKKKRERGKTFRGKEGGLLDKVLRVLSKVAIVATNLLGKGKKRGITDTEKHTTKGVTTKKPCQLERDHNPTSNAFERPLQLFHEPIIHTKQKIERKRGRDKRKKRKKPPILPFSLSISLFPPTFLLMIFPSPLTGNSEDILDDGWLPVVKDSREIRREKKEKIKSGSL